LPFFHTGDIVGVMSRPWRIEFREAPYHVLSRGNGQGNVFIDDEDLNDFNRFLLILTRVVYATLRLRNLR
jgi:hypothetical protein